MKVLIDQKSLLTLLSRTQNIVEKRNTMPVLINTLIEAQGNELRIFATNLEVSLKDQGEAQVITPGRAAVNAKSLFEIVKELPDQPIEIERLENNWVRISQAKSEFNIVGISPEEYPIFPTYSSKSFIKIEVDVLSDMIEKTIYSVSNDETRYHLNGVFFEQEFKKDGTLLRMVATDGHRLSQVDRKSKHVNSDFTEQGVIIPKKGLYEIRKLLDSGDGLCELAIEGSQLIVKYKSTILMIRLIEGKYPNYRQLIPQNLNEHIEIPKESLFSSLRRVSLLSNQKSKGVTFSFSRGKLQIASNNPELGEAKEELGIDYKGQEIKIGFNARYLMDVLNSIQEEKIAIDLKDQLSPGLIRPQSDADYKCVIMPMRI